MDGDAGAYGVAIADGASELESQDVAVFTVLIEVKGGEGVPRSVVWSLRLTTRLRDFSAVEIPRP